MMKVHLIDYTGKGRPDDAWHAANVLLFTKATRLDMTPGQFQKVAERPEREKLDELSNMAATIRSSWEFVDLTFIIEGVTRACAQQITRTRTGSYAMQSQRVVNVGAAPVLNPFPAGDSKGEAFDRASRASLAAYKGLLEAGAAPQDARGLLPMNIHCNLVAKYNLRSFTDLVAARQSMRTQDEYARIIQQMKHLVLEAWPWTETFFQSKQDKAIERLTAVAEEIGITTGNGPGWEIAKAVDLLRG